MRGHAQFPKLFTPVTLGPITLPNRFVVAPMTTNFANADGSVSDSVHDYLVARARARPPAARRVAPYFLPLSLYESISFWRSACRASLLPRPPPVALAAALAAASEL